MILFNGIVEVLVLTYQDINLGVGVNGSYGCSVRAALVDSDLLWHDVRVDGTFQKSPGSTQIALGNQQEVHRIASAVNDPVKVLPMSSHFDGGSFFYAPIWANGAFAPGKITTRERCHLDRL